MRLIILDLILGATILYGQGSQQILAALSSGVFPVGSTYRASVYSTSAAASYATTGTYTPNVNSLIVVFEVNSLASNPLEPTSVTGHGVSFSKLTLSARLLSTTHSLSAWVANAGATPSSAAVTASFNAVNQTGCALIEFEVTNWSGASAVAAVIQNPTNNGSATSGSVTLSAASKSTNRPLAFFVHLANEATTPRVNWTETAGADGNFNNPATGAAGQFRNDAFETTASATWTGNVAWRGVALEINGL